jgi:hypothetical protein
LSDYFAKLGLDKKAVNVHKASFGDSMHKELLLTVHYELVIGKKSR